MARSARRSRGTAAERIAAVLATAVTMLLAACTSPSLTSLPRVSADPTASASGSPSPSGAPRPGSGRYTKVMIIAESSRGYNDVLSARSAAPYLRGLAAAYGNATAVTPGYPKSCAATLPAYLLLTGGSTYGVCDDKSPRLHPVDGDNIFSQVAAAGLEWRNYAEAATVNCQSTNAARNVYVVKHVPAAYFTSEAVQCPFWVIPTGSLTGGALHADVAAGKLPSYAFVTPDACDDMQGAPGCRQNVVGAGDNWLRRWLPMIMGGPDYRAGRLVIIVTWDQGSTSDNHIPTLVISPTTSHLASALPFTHCSTLRTAEELLHLPFLGCAAGASSFVTAFHL